MRLPGVELGRLLGLKKPIIIGYLYGRLSVPDKVLDEARLLRLKPRLGSLGSTLAL